MAVVPKKQEVWPRCADHVLPARVVLNAGDKEKFRRGFYQAVLLPERQEIRQEVPHLAGHERFMKVCRHQGER